MSVGGQGSGETEEKFGRERIKGQPSGTESRRVRPVIHLSGSAEGGSHRESSEGRTRLKVGRGRVERRAQRGRCGLSPKGSIRP